VFGSNVNAFQSTNTPADLSIASLFFHHRELDTTMAMVTRATMAMVTMEMMAMARARVKAREV
jgi:hypothetical protein